MSVTTATELRQALNKWRPTKDGAFVILDEVRNGTGFSRKVDRTADALIFGCWPSRGYTIEGVEIKVSRSDWLKELADPTKADALAKFCHRWWLVTVPGVVEAGELPATWGLALYKRGVLRVESDPVENPTPATMDAPMLASVVRNASRQSDAAIRRAEKEGFDRGMRHAETNLARNATVIDDLHKQLTEVLGVDPLTNLGVAGKVRIGLEFYQSAMDAERDVMALRRIRGMAESIRSSADRLLADTEVADG